MVTRDRDFGPIATVTITTCIGPYGEHAVEMYVVTETMPWAAKLNTRGVWGNFLSLLIDSS